MRPGSSPEGSLLGRRLRERASGADPVWPPKLQPLSGMLGIGDSRPNSAGLLQRSLSGAGFLGPCPARPSAAAGADEGLPRSSSESALLLGTRAAAAAPGAGAATATAPRAPPLLLPPASPGSRSCGSRGSSAAISPARSGSVRGPSPKASAENLLVNKRLSALSSGKRKDSRVALVESDKSGAVPLDEDAFLAMVSSMESSIEALKRGSVAFDANSEARGGKEAGAAAPGRGANGANGNGAGRGEDEQEGAGGMSRAERVAMYKMCRKIEEDIPPLDRSFLEGSALPPPEQGLVRWNASQQAIGRFERQARMERMKSWNSLRARRGAEVAKVRRAKLEESQSQWSADLARKMRQGQFALEKNRRRRAMTAEALTHQEDIVASLAEGAEPAQPLGPVQE